MGGVGARIVVCCNGFGWGHAGRRLGGVVLKKACAARLLRARVMRRRARAWLGAVGARVRPAWRAAAASARTSVMGRSLRQSLHGLHAPWQLRRSMARSGLVATGITWSVVVVRPVHMPGRRSQHIGSSAMTCADRVRHARLERHLRICSGVAFMGSCGSEALIFPEVVWW